MKLDLKNSNWIMLTTVYVIASFICIFLPFFYTYGGSHREPFDITAVFIVCFSMIPISIKTWNSLVIRLSITDSEIYLTKWFGLRIKEKVIKCTDVEKIEIVSGIMGGDMFHIYLANKEKITIDLKYINQVEGELVDVVLTNQGLRDHKIVFILRVAKTISTKMKIPFHNSYIE